MKKTIFMMAAVAFMSIGCTKENIEDKTQQTEQKVITFSAGDESVKSVLDGKSVKWASGDHIAIYDGTTFINANKTRYNAHMFAYSSDYKFTYASNQRTSSNGIIDLNQEGAFYAVYPCLNDSGKNADVFELTDGGATLTTFLASRQMPKPNTFAAAANISACIPTVDAEERELNGVMKNLCGYIKFSIESVDSKIAYVKFSSNSGRKMSGRCNVVFKDGDATIDGLENRYVFCSSENGGVMAEGSYYVTVFPNEHVQGINIMIGTTEGKVYEYNTGKITIVANQVANLGAIDSKMGAGDSGKLSILLDFIAQNTNINDKSDKYSDILTLTWGGYQVPVTNLYAYNFSNGKKTSMWNPNTNGGNAVSTITTPAIPEMLLKNVVVTFYAHQSNCTANISLYTVDNLRCTGTYPLCKEPTGVDNKKYVLPTMNGSYNLRISHVLTPNEKSDGEGYGDPSTGIPAVAAETSYVLKNTGGACYVESIEFLYEPASAE